MKQMINKALIDKNLNWSRGVDVKHSLSWFVVLFSLEEHLPGVLRHAGLLRSVSCSLAPLDLRRQRQLQLLLRHNAAVQRGTGRTAWTGAGTSNDNTNTGVTSTVNETKVHVAASVSGFVYCSCCLTVTSYWDTLRHCVCYSHHAGM